jgi:hypothetical protein
MLKAVIGCIKWQGREANNRLRDIFMFMFTLMFLHCRPRLALFVHVMLQFGRHCFLMQLIMAAAMFVHLFCKPRDGHHADHQFNKFLYHCLIHLLLILLKPIRICRSPSDFSQSKRHNLRPLMPRWVSLPKTIS